MSISIRRYQNSLPLISGVRNIRHGELIENAKDQLKNQKINYDEDTKEAMIEVPSAAIAISNLLLQL